MPDKKSEGELPHHELTREILGSCFEVMKELGPGISTILDTYQAYQVYPSYHAFLLLSNVCAINSKKA